MPNRAQIIDSMADEVVGDPRAMLRLAELMLSDGQQLRAVGLCCDILMMPGVPASVATPARVIVNKSVPTWHQNIFFDRVRNQAYEAALVRAVKPGMRVLEIGAGSGILAMIAARAGPEHVYTCEVNPALARAAQEVIKANGLSDRITVLCKHSSDIDPERDMGGRADLLVSEILNDSVIGEQVLPSHEHAFAELLKSGAPVIPIRGTVRVALAYDPKAERFGFEESIEGFDMTAFRLLRPAHWFVPIGGKRLQLRGEAADILRFDLSGRTHTPPGKGSVDCVATGGPVNAVAQWMTFDLDDVTTHETRPTPGLSSSWIVNVFPLEAPRDLAPGDRVTVHASHDRTYVHIWTD